MTKSYFIEIHNLTDYPFLKDLLTEIADKVEMTEERRKNATIPNGRTAHWTTAHLHQKPSAQSTKGHSCTINFIEPVR